MADLAIWCHSLALAKMKVQTTKKEKKGHNQLLSDSKETERNTICQLKQV